MITPDYVGFETCVCQLVILFNETKTPHYYPHIGLAMVEISLSGVKYSG